MADWIAIASIVVNSLLAVWIVTSIQSRVSNNRSLKDYIIAEIIRLRDDYNHHFDCLMSDGVVAQEALAWYKMMGNRIATLSNSLASEYGLDQALLGSFHSQLRLLVTNNSDFMAQYKSKRNVAFKADSKSSFLQFRSEHEHIFHDIVVLVNKHQ
jgi:hypothetical protein